MKKARQNSRVTIYQVAKEANVSLATVSRVINGVSVVNPSTRILVERAIKKLGYVPSNVARGLAKSSSTNVAIVLPSPNYSYISSIMSGMLDVCKIYGYYPYLFTYEDPEDAARVVEKVMSSRVEGICCFNSELGAYDLQRMTNINLPMVLISEASVGDNALVDIDYSEKLHMVIKRMLNRGVKKVVYLRNPRKDWHIVGKFEKAITEAVYSHEGCQYECLLINDAYTTIYESFMKKFATNPPNHELYIATRDSLATAIVNAARDSGYQPPKDLEVIGVIGTKQARMCRPMISTIDIDLYEVGSVAMRMLTKMLQGKLDDKLFRFKTEYHKRDSTID